MVIYDIYVIEDILFEREHVSTILTLWLTWGLGWFQYNGMFRAQGLIENFLSQKKYASFIHSQYIKFPLKTASGILYFWT